MKLAQRLLSQHVEVVGRIRRLRHCERILGSQLEEPLQASGEVVGALTFVAVRQQQDDARLLSPLRLTRNDELINDRLSAVGEITKLRLPEDERLRARH